jgi:hypothetical protein
MGVLDQGENVPDIFVCGFKKKDANQGGKIKIERGGKRPLQKKKRRQT